MARVSGAAISTSAVDDVPKGLENSAAAWTVCVLAVGQAAAQSALIARGIDFVVAHLTIDDTFYYLQVARNLWDYGFPTFDGTNPTNGLQLLWFWGVFLLAGVFPGKVALVNVTLAVCALLNLLAYPLIWKTGRLLNRPGWAPVAAACWLFLNARSYLSGMENSLHALLFWVLICVGAEIASGGRDLAVARSAVWKATVTLCLLVWARVDSAVFAVPLFVWLVWTVEDHSRSRSEAVRSLVLPSLVCVVLAAALFATSYWMGGTPLPIRGAIRMRWYDWSVGTTADVVVHLLRSVFPLFGLAPKGMPSLVALLGGLVFLVLPIVMSRASRVRQPLVPREFRGFLGVLLGASAVHVIYLGGLGGLATNAVRYHSPEFISFICLLAFIACGVIGWVRDRWGARAGVIVLTSIAALCVGGYVKRTVKVLRKPLEPDLHYQRPQLARWVGQNLPREWRCAAWNAGELGYFAPQQFVNLDGLVNSRAYFERVMDGGVPLLDYLEEQGVDCIVDYDIREKDASLYSQFGVRRTAAANDHLLEVLVRKPGSS